MYRKYCAKIDLKVEMKNFYRNFVIICHIFRPKKDGGRMAMHLKSSQFKPPVKRITENPSNPNSPDSEFPSVIPTLSQLVASSSKRTHQRSRSDATVALQGCSVQQNKGHRRTPSSGLFWILLYIYKIFSLFFSF